MLVYEPNANFMNFVFYTRTFLQFPNKFSVSQKDDRNITKLKKNACFYLNILGDRLIFDLKISKL